MAATLFCVGPLDEFRVPAQHIWRLMAVGAHQNSVWGAIDLVRGYVFQDVFCPKFSDKCQVVFFELHGFFVCASEVRLPLKFDFCKCRVRTYLFQNAQSRLRRITILAPPRLRNVLEKNVLTSNYIIKEMKQKLKYQEEQREYIYILRSMNVGFRIGNMR